MRINIDDALASLDQCATKDDRLDWLDGLRFGLRGGTRGSTTGSTQWEAGFLIGSDAYADAVAFQALQKEKSALGVAARTHKQPVGQPVGQPAGIPISNNRVIEESRERKNHQSTVGDDSVSFLETAKALKRQYGDMIRYVSASELAQAIVDFGAKAVSSRLERAKKLGCDLDASGFDEALNGRKSAYGGWDVWEPLPKLGRESA